MKISEIDALAALEKSASDGPWYVRHMDDEDYMGAVAIANTPPVSVEGSMRSGGWPGNSVIAVCLLQAPSYAIIDDDRFEENARLICEIRNNLPEILRLARLGLSNSLDGEGK